MNAVRRCATFSFLSLVLATASGGCVALPGLDEPGGPTAANGIEPQARAAPQDIPQTPVESEPAKPAEGGSTGALEPRVDLGEQPEEKPKMKAEMRGRINVD